MVEAILCTLSALAAIGSARFALQKQSWVVGLWVPALTTQSVYYILILARPDLFEFMRDTVYRPSAFLLLLGIITFTFNGRVNVIIDTLIDKVAGWKFKT